ncbi:MAG: energy transducer TonB [Chitinivibrionales bacterium]|nr:energy transducer TonB [Chitinivibrionales bacterium]MBD3394866.1 energy transducer TonB [Chitinivibrionales bacterium]
MFRGIAILGTLSLVCLQAASSGAAYPGYIPQGLSDLAQGAMIRGGQDQTSDLTVSGSGVTSEDVDVSGQDFTQAKRIVVSEAAQHPWDVNMRTSVDQSVSQDDVFLFVFWAKGVSSADETGAGYITALFEEAGGNWTKSLSRGCTPRGEWEQYAFSFEAAGSYASGEAHFGFNFGSRAQTIDIGGIELIHFGTSVSLDDLEPFATKPTYAGREPDAAWRAEAEARIEQIRKADCTLKIVANGDAVRDARVHAVMKEHAFGFGTAINASRIQGTGSNTYMDTIKALFNKAVIENSLKWKQWTPNPLQAASTAIDWLNSQGIQVRGHVLVWPSWGHMPDWVSHDNAATLSGQITDHIDEAVTMFKDDLVEWDVINEPYTNHDAMDLIGDNAMIEWFERARENDPNVKLYINDYGILAGDDAAHRDHYETTIQFLVEGGAPLDGIGLQGHFGESPTPPFEVVKRLDRFAEFGKELQITEFDVNTTNDSLQADYTRDFMTVVFSHPGVVGFLMWGFWANAHWKPDAAMYTSDWTPKKNAKAYRKLVFEEWWTDEEGDASGGGEYAFRGFRGDYEITVESGGGTRSFELALDADKTAVLDIESGEVLSAYTAVSPRLISAIELSFDSARAALVSMCDVPHELSVFDNRGRQIVRLNRAQGGRYVRDVSSFAAGAYVARISLNGVEKHVPFCITR